MYNFTKEPHYINCDVLLKFHNITRDKFFAVAKDDANLCFACAALSFPEANVNSEHSPLVLCTFSICSGKDIERMNSNLGEKIALGRLSKIVERAHKQGVSELQFFSPYVHNGRSAGIHVYNKMYFREGSYEEYLYDNIVHYVDYFVNINYPNINTFCFINKNTIHEYDVMVSSLIGVMKNDGNKKIS